MEIEFNPSRVPQPRNIQPVERRELVRTNSELTSPAVSSPLEDKLKNVQVVRPERVAQAKALVADDKYPPDVLLNGIAALLAMSVNKK